MIPLYNEIIKKNPDFDRIKTLYQAHCTHGSAMDHAHPVIDYTEQTEKISSTQANDIRAILQIPTLHIS